jgi:hypothetical protein
MTEMATSYSAIASYLSSGFCFNLFYSLGLKINQTFVIVKKSLPMAALFYKWLLVSGFCFLVGLPKGYAYHSDVIPFKESRKFHPFYISVTEINHNTKDKTLEISCKLFADDFEEVLKKNYKSILDLTSDKDKSALDKFIPDYINKHLFLTVDGRPVKLSYVGFEKEKESAYCYFQVDNVASVKKLNLTNSILFDYNQNEINIVHVVVGGKRQSTKLENPASDANFGF